MSIASTRSPQRQDGRSSPLRGTARERLLDAAADLFAERGFRGASVDDIAAQAGLTKGALYWNFKSKDELFFALVEERVDRPLRALMDLTGGAPKDQETAPHVSRGIAEVVDQQRQLVLLMHEYWALAVRDPQLCERYVERQRSLTKSLAQTLEARHQTTGVALTISAQRLATAIMALANGLAIERIADPKSVPEDLLREMLSLIYDGLVLRAGTAERGTTNPRLR
jgi:AcrR family transcriptional regulator